jgi:hypothetical protein
MSLLRQRLRDEAEEHDVSKELFLGIMMLMLCLGIMILNVASPVWRVHQHDPGAGDVAILYTPTGMALSKDGKTAFRSLRQSEFKGLVNDLVRQPKTDLHLYLKGGSREMLVRHAAFADSFLSVGPAGRKVRAAVYMHGW